MARWRVPGLRYMEASSFATFLQNHSTLHLAVLLVIPLYHLIFSTRTGLAPCLPLLCIFFLPRHLLLCRDYQV